MTCSAVQAQLSAYRDGELTAADADAVARHLAECAGCGAYLQDLARLGELLNTSQACELPHGVWGRIASAAQCSAPARRLHLRQWSVRVAALAAGFAIYLFGYDAMTHMLPAQQPVLASDMTPLEDALRETGTVLAGYEPAGTPLRILEDLPESQLLTELAKELRP